MVGSSGRSGWKQGQDGEVGRKLVQHNNIHQKLCVFKVFSD